MIELIAKKRDGGRHSPKELEFIARAAAGGQVPDYQLSAWLMAVCTRGMDEGEAVALTRAMAASGARLDLSSLKTKAVDKHSTGGVGDGISIALAPLVAEAGLLVPMMSGRGLGHTGGTLDKLESIPGLRVSLTLPEIASRLADVGVCLFGQTEELAPSDRKLYALRDATGTVPSLPLIVGSILSKKLAEDLDALVLDIKCGTGAIFQTRREAVTLGRALVKTAGRLGLRTAALVTAMDQPLGRAVGNALEVRQAVAVLQGDRSPADFVELLLALGGWMLHLAGRARTWTEGAETLETILREGRGVERFKRLVRAQGGDPAVADDPDRVLPRARLSRGLKSPGAGFLSRLDALTVGRAAVALGAGRERMEDKVDFGAGIELLKKVADPVARGEEVARLYASTEERLSRGESLLREAVQVSPRRPKSAALIQEVLRP